MYVRCTKVQIFEAWVTSSFQKAKITKFYKGMQWKWQTEKQIQSYNWLILCCRYCHKYFQPNSFSFPSLSNASYFPFHFHTIICHNNIMYFSHTIESWRVKKEKFHDSMKNHISGVTWKYFKYSALFFFLSLW